MKFKLCFPGLTQRSLSVEQRGEGDDVRPCIQGYGAVFYNATDPGSEFWLWDDTVEHIMPGAFDNSLARDDVRSFFNHDGNHILGRRKVGGDSNTMALAVDNIGLQYSIDADADDPFTQHVLRAIARGDVDGSSFMFRPVETNWRDEQVEVNGHNITIYVREVIDVEMFEVGPVVFPAYESTTAASRSALSRDPMLTRYCQWLDSHLSEARADFARFQRSRPEAREARSKQMAAVL